MVTCNANMTYRERLPKNRSFQLHSNALFSFLKRFLTAKIKSISVSDRYLLISKYGPHHDHDHDQENKNRGLSRSSVGRRYGPRLRGFGLLARAGAVYVRGTGRGSVWKK